MSAATDAFDAKVKELDGKIDSLVAENVALQAGQGAAVATAVDAFATSAAAELEPLEQKIDAALTPSA